MNDRVDHGGAFVLAALMLALGGCGTSEESGSGTKAASAVTSSSQQPAQSPAHRQARVARHSSGQTTPGLGRRTRFAACQIRGLLPDPACTPGAIFVGA